MNEEEKKMLEETLALSKENNEMLHKVRGAQKQAAFFRFAYWAFIILAGVGAFYFIQPYVDSITGTAKEVNTSINDFKSLLR